MQSHREWLLQQHGSVCAYCGVETSPDAMTLDHVRPRRGQTAYDRADNLVLACRDCNAAKADTPRIFLYDAYPGGIGFSAPLWGMQTDLLSKTSALIAGCDCESGCPMCVGPIGETGPLAKTVALRILEHLLAGVRAIPERAEEVPF